MRKYSTRIASRQNSVNQYFRVLGVLFGVFAVLVGVHGVLVGQPGVLVGVLSVLVGVLGVFVGVLDVLSIGMVCVLHLVFGMVCLVISLRKISGFCFSNSELTLKKAVHLIVRSAKKYASLKKVC